MSYSKWRKANMSEIERHTVMDALSGFTSFKGGPVGIDEKTGMSHKMAKRGLQWLKKVKDLKKQSEQVRITDVQALSEEVCMMADDMFEETPVDKPSDSREGSFAESNSESPSSSSDDDSDDDTMDLQQLMKDPEMKNLFGLNNKSLNQSQSQDQNPLGTMFSGLGGMMGGMVSGMMGGLVGKKNPLIIASLEDILKQLNDKLDKSDGMTPEDVQQTREAEFIVRDLIASYDDPSISSDDLTKKYVQATQEATKAGIKVKQNQEQVNPAELKTSLAQMDELQEACSVM